MKPVHDIYTPETRALVEAFNSKTEAIDAERAEIDRERSAVAVDALDGKAPAAKLRKAMDALRTRALQADIDELVARRDLPAIDAGHKADWSAERDRIRAQVEARVAVLNKHADELRLEKPARHGLILADVDRRDLERRAQQASEMIRNGAQTNMDIARAEQLKMEIAKALR